QAIVKVENDFVQRQFVGQHHSIRGYVLKAFLLSALFFQQRQDSAQVFFRSEDRRADGGLFNLRQPARLGHLCRRINFRDLAVSGSYFIAHAGRRGDQIEIELALQTLLHNLHVQQSEEATTKTKTESGGRLGFVKERRVIQAQLVHRIAQLFVLVCVHRI